MSADGASSVGGLLRPASAPADPASELVSLWDSLARRTYAGDPAVQEALQVALRELSSLRAAQARGASAERLQRQTALVWAALARADRLEARIQTAAALAGLKARAEASEQAADRAREAYERERAEAGAKAAL